MTVITKPKLQGQQVGNAIGKRYRAHHIKPGLVGYPENPELGTILVTHEALEKMRPSFIGKPVVNMDHSDMSPEELFNFSARLIENPEEIAVGVVSDAGIDEKGWEYVDMLIWDEATQKNIDNRGYSVSNAYDVTKEGPGGKENQIPYDHELIDGEYLHMAIVPNPRYQGARIYANSLRPGGKTMGMNLFKKKKAQNMEPDEENDESVAENEGIEVGDAVFVDKETGEEIPAEEILNAYRQMNMEDEEPEKTTLNAEDEVEVDGKKVKVGDMYNAYKNMKKMNQAENAELPTDTQAEEVVDESLQNQVKNSTGKKPVNRKLKNAVENGDGYYQSTVMTRSKRLEQGKQRYGSKVSQGAK